MELGWLVGPSRGGGRRAIDRVRSWHRAAFYLLDTSDREEVLGYYNDYVGAGRGPEERARLIEEALANAGPRARESFSVMCEVAQVFARWMGLGVGVQDALEFVFSR